MSSLVPISSNGNDLVSRFAEKLNTEFNGEYWSFQETITLLSRYSHRPDIRTKPIEDKIAHTFEVIVDDKELQKIALDRWQNDLKILSKLTKFVNENREDISALIDMNKTDYNRAVKEVYEQHKDYRIKIPEILIQNNREEDMFSIQAPRLDRKPKDDGCSIM